MNIDQNLKTGKVKVDLEDKDIADAIAIINLIESDGWKILKSYFEVEREGLIEDIKLSTHTRGKVDLCPLKAARLEGYDFWMMVPKAIEQRYEIYKQEQEGKKDDGQNDGFGLENE